MKTFLTLLFQFVNLLLYAQDFSLYQKKEFRNQDGAILPYRILYPENYDKGKKYPVVLFLHGAGERGNDNERQLKNVAGTFLMPEKRSAFPCIVIAPQCPENSFWSSVELNLAALPLRLAFDYKRPMTAPLAMAVELLKKTIADEAVDPDRVYIMGLSMGGMGTFEAVYHNPALFAAAVPICGGADVDAYDKRVKHVPFWVFHGEKDDVVNVSFSRTIVEKLKKLKVKVKYTEYPGVGHNSWDKAFAEPGLFDWEFSKKKH